MSVSLAPKVGIGMPVSSTPLTPQGAHSHSQFEEGSLPQLSLKLLGQHRFCSGSTFHKVRTPPLQIGSQMIHLPFTKEKKSSKLYVGKTFPCENLPQ